MVNYYKNLGVQNFVLPEEIKKAYRKLAKKFHPDVNVGDNLFEEIFKELYNAYEILSDPQRRNIYDRNLKRSLKLQSSIHIVRRPSSYIFERGKLVKRRRL
jgi:DnaJ-class molecular chaperone